MENDRKQIANEIARLCALHPIGCMPLETKERIGELQRELMKLNHLRSLAQGDRSDG